MKDYNYSFFLFTMLILPYIPEYVEYDVLYDRIVNQYDKYVISEYNDLYRNEYECMEDFIKKEFEN
jgi:hypothetical protein